MSPSPVIGRIQMLCHPITAAVKTAAFPGDEPLDDEGLLQLAARHPILRPARRALTSPERRCRQTAATMGIDAAVAPALRECDYGRWAGRSLADVAGDDPAGLDDWLNDIGSTPHGGEPLAALMARVADWLEEQSGVAGRTVAFTHASVIRAAVVHVLGAPPRSFWRITIAPLTCATFGHHAGRWLLSALAGPRDVRTFGSGSASGLPHSHPSAPVSPGVG